MVHTCNVYKISVTDQHCSPPLLSCYGLYVSQGCYAVESVTLMKLIIISHDSAFVINVLYENTRHCRQCDVTTSIFKYKVIALTLGALL